MTGFDVDKVAALVGLPDDHIMGPMWRSVKELKILSQNRAKFLLQSWYLRTHSSILIMRRILKSAV